MRIFCRINVNAQDPKLGKTALHWAVEKNANEPKMNEVTRAQGCLILPISSACPRLPDPAIKSRDDVYT
jgi:hypothetical protein